MLSEFETLLDESASYVLVHVCESVYLQERATGRSFTVGDHYGDPVKGIIGPEEDWFMSFGEGVQIFTFAYGCESIWYGHGKIFAPDVMVGTLQGRPVESTLTDTLFLHDARLEADGTVRILLDPWSDYASVWSLDFPRRRLVKFHDGPVLRDQPWRDDVDF